MSKRKIFAAVSGSSTKCEHANAAGEQKWQIEEFLREETTA
jgi:hypothetical protein